MHFHDCHHPHPALHGSPNNPGVPCSQEADYHKPSRPLHVHSNRLKWVIVLTMTYMLVELVGGWWTHSLALLGDAAHMFSDSVALVLAWFASWIAQKPQNSEKTYGYYRAEILAAFANGIALILVAVGIAVEAVHRLATPEAVNGEVLFGVAVGGLVINIVAALILHRDSAHNMNVRAAWLHVLSDALGSVGAIIAGIAISFGASSQVDVVVSLVIVVLIVWNSWRMIEQTMQILLEACPSHLDTDAIKTSLEGVVDVEEVHDLHVWTITTGQDALSVHLVVENMSNCPTVLHQSHEILQKQFGIYHATIQIEPPHFWIDEETHNH